MGDMVLKKDMILRKLDKFSKWVKVPAVVKAKLPEWILQLEPWQIFLILWLIKLPLTISMTVELYKRVSKMFKAWRKKKKKDGGTTEKEELVYLVVVTEVAMKALADPHQDPLVARYYVISSIRCYSRPKRKNIIRE